MSVTGVVSGGFDPLHAGHARMLLQAEKLCDTLVVLVNTDDWLRRKKGYVSVPIEHRMEVVSAIVRRAEVRPARDDDGTVVADLADLASRSEGTVVFMNGGDRKFGNVPEESVEGVQMLYGIGGDDKTNSSSTIAPSGYLGRCERLWGYYEDHFRTEKCVFKTLYVRAGESTSMQRHALRSETWYVESGHILVDLDNHTYFFGPGDHCNVPRMVWHRLKALVEPAVVREMQYGILCSETDIERKL